MTDRLDLLAAQGFTYVSIDLSKGAFVTAWHKNDRKTYQASARTIDDAVTAVLDQASEVPSKKPKDSAAAVSSMFEDILG